MYCVQVLQNTANQEYWLKKVVQISGKDNTSFLPINYISGPFIGSQKNWVPLTKEAYAICMASKKLSYYMLESILSVTTHIYTRSLLLTP